MTAATLNKPTPPADRPPLSSAANAPNTVPGFVPGSLPELGPNGRGSWLRPSPPALILSIDGPHVMNPSIAPRAKQFRTEIDAESKRRIRAAVAQMPDDALQQARQRVTDLTRRLPQLDAISDEWAARHRRLQVEDAAVEQIEEARRAFTAADAEHAQAEAALALAKETLAGLETARRRNAESAADAILRETVEALRQRREGLFSAIAAKVATELAGLVEVETRLHSLGRDYPEWAKTFAAEALQAKGE